MTVSAYVLIQIEMGKAAEVAGRLERALQAVAG